MKNLKSRNEFVKSINEEASNTSTRSVSGTVQGTHFDSEQSWNGTRDLIPVPRRSMVKWEWKDFRNFDDKVYFNKRKETPEQDFGLYKINLDGEIKNITPKVYYKKNTYTLVIIQDLDNELYIEISKDFDENDLKLKEGSFYGDNDYIDVLNVLEEQGFIEKIEDHYRVLSY